MLAISAVGDDYDDVSVSFSPLFFAIPNRIYKSVAIRTKVAKNSPDSRHKSIWRAVTPDHINIYAIDETSKANGDDGARATKRRSKLIVLSISCRRRSVTVGDVIHDKKPRMERLSGVTVVGTVGSVSRR